MPLSQPKNNSFLSPPGSLVCAFLAAFFLFFAVCPSPCHAADGRRPLIYGIASLPFPLISNFGYPLARAEAWLAALEDARTKLAPAVLSRLRTTGYSSPLAERAFCALVFPLDVVTPEKAAAKVVRVFLKSPKMVEEILANLLANPWLLAKEMSIVQETTRNVHQLRLNWPKSLAAAQKVMANLEIRVVNLDSLWKATNLVEKELNGSRPDWLSVVRAIPESAPVLLEIAKETDDMELADKAVSMAMREHGMSVSREERSVWNRIIGEALLLRGKSHEHLGQNALAETDYSAALARLSKNGVNDKLMLDLSLARGDLRKTQKNFAGMCEDYSMACALGSCQQLAIARRDGQCGAGK